MKVHRLLAMGAGTLLLSGIAVLGAPAWADDPTPAPGATSATVEPCESTESSDGTVTQTCPDGTTYTANPDGSSVWTDGKGCTITTAADGSQTKDGDCPEVAPGIGIGGGCWQATDANGDPAVDPDGNPLTVCADGVAPCDATSPDQACPMAYSMGAADSGLPGRENCPQCRTLSGGIKFKNTDGLSASLDTNKLGNDLALVDAAVTPADKAAALEAAASNQPAVALPASAQGSSKGAGPVAPVTLAVIGGGCVAAGAGAWRVLARGRA